MKNFDKIKTHLPSRLYEGYEGFDTRKKKKLWGKTPALGTLKLCQAWPAYDERAVLSSCLFN